MPYPHIVLESARLKEENVSRFGATQLFENRASPEAGPSDLFQVRNYLFERP